MCENASTHILFCIYNSYRSSVCVCVCARARVCMCVCVRACVCVFMLMFDSLCQRERESVCLCVRARVRRLRSVDAFEQCHSSVMCAFELAQLDL